MRTLQEEEINEYVSFFRNYYPLQDLKLCVIIANEREWKTIFNWYEEGSEILQKIVDEEPDNIETTVIEVSEGHKDETTTWKDVVGMYAYGNNMLNCIHLSKNDESFHWLKKLLEGKEWFIMLRAKKIEDRRDFLDFLFHEILHVIEIKLQTPIYRGSSVEQETKDEREIVRPYVIRFMNKGF